MPQDAFHTAIWNAGGTILEELDPATAGGSAADLCLKVRLVRDADVIVCITAAVVQLPTGERADLCTHLTAALRTATATGGRTIRVSDAGVTDSPQTGRRSDR